MSKWFKPRLPSPQTGPAGLYKSATEQIKKAEAVKAMRKHLIAEEEDWQQVRVSRLESPPLGFSSLPSGLYPGCRNEGPLPLVVAR